MPLFQAAWLFYMDNSALVLNSLALFYALCGTWLVVATQLRAARTMRLVSNSAGVLEDELPIGMQRSNRLFVLVGCVCLGLGLLLSLASSLI